MTSLSGVSTAISKARKMVPAAAYLGIAMLVLVFMSKFHIQADNILAFMHASGERKAQELPVAYHAAPCNRPEAVAVRL